MARSELTLQERTKVIESKKDNGTGSSLVNSKSTSYMAIPDVKEFNKEMQKRIFTNSNGGRPYAFKSVEWVEEQLVGFFELCERTNTVPTIVNLALYLGVHRDTIYAHANDKNSPYSDILSNCITYFHSVMENGVLAGKINPVTYIFLGKNYFGLKDAKDITVTPTSNSSQINSSDTMEAIQKQIEEENVPNAEISEE